MNSAASGQQRCWTFSAMRAATGLSALSSSRSLAWYTPTTRNLRSRAYASTCQAVIIRLP